MLTALNVTESDTERIGLNKVGFSRFSILPSSSSISLLFSSHRSILTVRGAIILVSALHVLASFDLLVIDTRALE